MYTYECKLEELSNTVYQTDVALKTFTSVDRNQQEIFYFFFTYLLGSCKYCSFRNTFVNYKLELIIGRTYEKNPAKNNFSFTSLKNHSKSYK